MKLKIIAIQHAHGVSKKTDKPYSMRRVVRLADLSPIDSEKYVLEGSGYTPVELSISDSFYDEALSVFNCLFDDSYVLMDFEMGLDSFNNNIVVGFSAGYLDSLDKSIKNKVSSDSVKSSSKSKLFN